MSLEILSKNKNTLLKNLTCPLCNSNFVFKLLNNKTQIIVCTNEKCIFPFSEKEMDNFIFNKDSMKFDDFFSNIKNILNCRFSSDDSNENKIDEIENDIENDNADSLENMDYNGGIFGSPLSSINEINSVGF